MNNKNLIAIGVAAVVVVLLIVALPAILGDDSPSTGTAPAAAGDSGGSQAPAIQDGAEMPPDHPPIDGDEGQPAGVDAEAVAEAEQAYEENPTDLQVLIDLGNVYLAAQRPEDASRIFTEALAVDGESTEAKAGLGMAKFAQGDAEGAKADLEQATKNDPSNQAAFYDLAVVYFSSNERDKAKEAWQAAAAIDDTTELGRLASEFLTLMESGGSSGQNPHSGGTGTPDTTE
jgi:tetratricopeptide (TPR) repeat protein